MRDLSFKELKQIYNKKGKNCGDFGYIFKPKHKENRVITGVKHETVFYPNMKLNGKTIYNVKGTISTIQDPVYYEEWIPDQLLPLRCHRFSCCICRPGQKIKVYNRTVQEICQNNMNFHYIQTFPGNWLRKEIPFYESYKIMNKENSKLRRIINYELKKLKKGIKTRSVNPIIAKGYKTNEYELKMISFPRAQTKPEGNNPIGFCHLHNIVNIPLNVHWISEKIIKNDLKLGKPYITKNHDVADYLINDFWNDQEWYIPFGQRHYITTENIHLNPGKYEYMDPNNIIYRNQDLNTCLNNEDFIKYIEWDLNTRGHNLPFEEYVNQFYENIGSNQNIDPIVRNKINYNEIIEDIIGGDNR